MAWIAMRRVCLAGALVAGCTGREAGGDGGDDGGLDDAGTEGQTSAASDATAGGDSDPSGGVPTSGGPAICEGDDGWAGSDDGGGSSGGDDGTGTDSFGMDDDMPLVATTYEIQQGVYGPGDLVALDGVVLTTPSTLTGTGAAYEVFVQDPAGGEWSGVRVRLPLFDPMDVAAVGDAVDVVGRVYRRDGFYLVYVSGPAAGLTGKGPAPSLPPPVVLSAEDLLPGNEVARPYEGVPIRVEQVVVTDDDPCDGEFVIEQTARVDDRFVPGQLPTPTNGTMLDAVGGVLIYAIDAFEIAPRQAAEVE